MSMYSSIISKIAFIGLLWLCFPAAQLEAQYDNGIYIYGTITTTEGDKFTGFIRWGKEEMYWHDVFNSVKTDNFKRNPTKKNSSWKNMDWSFSSIWKDKYSTGNHVFACFFGDIAEMNIKRGERVHLLFKNDAELEVDGGSNDIGTTLRVWDYELGKISIDWEDLKHIKFFAAPNNIESPYGKPLYGTVYTNRKREFTGHIKWDMDERNGLDILDGESRLGDQKIPFEKISSIDKLIGGEGIDILFESGRTLRLDGSNDCDSGNRGIGIFVEALGNLEIAWQDFIRLDFSSVLPQNTAYDNFPVPEDIRAKVLTYDGKIHSGYIAFDRDEIWSFEFLDGDDDDIEFQIPMRNIERITPKNRAFSMVELRNGEQLLLGDRQDVSRNNNGILLFTGSSDLPIEIDWDDIEEIVFK